ncbi:hypothetical protein ABS71_11615 [bacterium SCN 62-11]|nr:DUF4118 domain-containing protein [Candidatus Eremiobacteraeota bacterium]ODT66547.1 MAG: hypothetical protein ABS71_11615 [bacterium SCN 62-11]
MNSIPWSISPSTRGWRYAIAVSTVVLVGLFLAQGADLVSEDNEMLLYLGTLVFAALYLGRGPTRAATVTSLFILNVGHIHPGFRIGFHKFQYVISFGIFLVLSEQIARLADNVRREAWQSEELYLFTQECARLTSPQKVLELLCQHARRYCGLELFASLAQIKGAPLQTPRGIYGWVTPAVQGNLLLDSLQAQTALALERIVQSERSRQASVLEATQKLQSTLINSISHDLQTPISSIRGSVDTLKTCELPDQDRQVLLDLASDQIARLQKLVQNILNLSKIEAGGLILCLRWISVEEMVAGVVEGFPAPARARIRWQVAEEIPEVQADFSLLSQLLSNLLDNALKFSQGPVAVEVSAGLNSVRLSVSDQGFGVAPTEREKIFERFYRGQTPRHVPGTGLGLNICLGIAELHHATLRVEALEPGSRFVLEMPRKQEVTHV